MGIRLKIVVDKDERWTKKQFWFFLFDFPARVNKKDLMHLGQLTNGCGLTDEQIEQLQSLSWKVDFVSWERDERGFYQEVYVSGE